MANQTETPQERGRRMLGDAGYKSDVKVASNVISRKRGGAVKKAPHTQVNIVVAAGKDHGMGADPQAQRGMMHEGMHARPPMMPGPGAGGPPPGGPMGGPPPGAGPGGPPPMMPGRPPMGGPPPGAPMPPPGGPPIPPGMRPPGQFAKGGAVEAGVVRVKGYKRRKAGGGV